MSWLMVESGILDGEGEMSVSKPDELPTQDVREMNGNEGIYETIMYRNKLGNNNYTNQLTFNKFSSALLLDIMTAM